MYRRCQYILHQISHIDCSAPSGEQHEPLTGVWGISTVVLYDVSFNVIWLTLPPHREFNSWAHGRFKVNFRWVFFKLSFVFNGWGISCETVLIWMSLGYTSDKSTLVQVMAWCRQATSHYLSQCWPRPLTPCSVSRPQWYDTDTNLKPACSDIFIPLRFIDTDWPLMSM